MAPRRFDRRLGLHVNPRIRIGAQRVKHIGPRARRDDDRSDRSQIGRRRKERLQGRGDRHASASQQAHQFEEPAALGGKGGLRLDEARGALLGLDDQHAERRLDDRRLRLFRQRLGV